MLTYIRIMGETLGFALRHMKEMKAEVTEKEVMKKMKKILIVGILAFAMIASAGLASAADHDYDTTFSTSWSGAGYLDGTFTSGDDLFAKIQTLGNMFSGTWSGTDSNDNPYTYGVDTSWTQLDAKFSGGGYINFATDRNDAHSGNPGQWTYSSVMSDDGLGEMAKHEWVNYESVKSCNYNKPRTSGGHHFEADGSNYGIRTELGINSKELAFVGLHGKDGNAYLDLMNSDTWRDDSFNFGRGCGCYTDADWQFTGTTSFDFVREAWADNSLTIHNDGSVIPGGPSQQAHYYEWIQGAGTYGENDMSMSGN